MSEYFNHNLQEPITEKQWSIDRADKGKGKRRNKKNKKIVVEDQMEPEEVEAFLFASQFMEACSLCKGKGKIPSGVTVNEEMMFRQCPSCEGPGVFINRKAYEDELKLLKLKVG